MIVTLAGPGSGKTTDLLNQIKAAISIADANREIAVITYTNASAEELLKKIKETQNIPHNLFIGTIHSFLFRYYIQAFAQTREYKTSNTIIVDKFSDAGVEWIDSWVNQNSGIEKNKKNQIKKSMFLSKRNSQMKAAAKKRSIHF